MKEYHFASHQKKIQSQVDLLQKSVKELNKISRATNLGGTHSQTQSKMSQAALSSIESLSDLACNTI